MPGAPPGSFPRRSFPRRPREMARNFWDPGAGLQGLFDGRHRRRRTDRLTAGLSGFPSYRPTDAGPTVTHMRRITCREFGPSDQLTLEEAPDPRPGPGEILVQVRAAGVSFVDGLIAGGKYQLKPPLPFTPGLVAAGEVLATGDGVTGLRAGDRVVGSTTCWPGSPPENCTPSPRKATPSNAPARR